MASWWDAMSSQSPWGSLYTGGNTPFRTGWGTRLGTYMDPGGTEAGAFENEDAAFQSSQVLNAMGLGQGQGGNPFRQYLADQGTRNAAMAQLMRYGQENGPTQADIMGRLYASGFGGAGAGRASLQGDVMSRLQALATGATTLGSNIGAGTQRSWLLGSLMPRYSSLYQQALQDKIEALYQDYTKSTQQNGTPGNFFAYAQAAGLIPGAQSTYPEPTSWGPTILPAEGGGMTGGGSPGAGGEGGGQTPQMGGNQLRWDPIRGSYV